MEYLGVKLKVNKSLLFFALAAWIGLDAYLISGNTVVIKLIVYGAFICVFTSGLFSKKIDTQLFGIVFLIISFYFHIPGEGSLNNIIGFGFIPLSIVFFLTEESKCILYKYFKLIFVLSLIPGLVIYFLDVSGVSIPYTDITVFEKRQIGEANFVVDYIGFMGNTKQLISNTFSFYRFEGMYNEPGVVGTLSALLLVVSQFEIKSWENKVLIVSGLLSLSLAFYVILLFHFLLSSSNIKHYMIFLASIIVVVNLPITKHYLADRFKIDNYTLKGDNRVSDDFSFLYTQDIDNGDVYNKIFGLGSDAHAKKGYNVSSYKQLIYNKGYLGIILIISFYLIYIYKHLRSTKLRLIMLIVLLSIYQRPEVMTLFFTVVFAGGISLMNNQSEKMYQLNIS